MLKFFRLISNACVIAVVPCAASAGTTQIVVQWPSDKISFWTFQLFRLQSVLDDHAAQGGYRSDGNDVGGGVVNFYLYADDARVDAVVRNVVAMRTQNLLPDGMQIGVAVYKDAKRKDWSYRPAYPKTLKKFDIL
jgi:hypothetical protein